MQISCRSIRTSSDVFAQNKASEISEYPCLFVLKIPFNFHEFKNIVFSKVLLSLLKDHGDIYLHI